jgi:hypothetical protein
MTPLKIRERPKHYRVDRHVALLFPKADGAKPAETLPMVQAMRREINRAGDIASARTRQELADRPAARALAQRLIKILDKARPLLAGDPDDLAAGLVAIKRDRSAAKAIDQLDAWIRYLLDGFQLIEPSTARSNPLAGHFIDAMAQVYFRYRGEPAPRGRSGPFVDLVVDAWGDLRFSEPSTGREQKTIPDLDRWFGHKIESRFKHLVSKNQKK